MLYYILFWKLLGLIIHFCISFGTNLLTGGLAENCCFLPISVFRRKRISNRVQTECNRRECDFRNKRDPEDLESKSRNQPGEHEAGGRAYSPGRALHPRGLLGCFLACTPSPLDDVHSKNHAPEGFILFALSLICLFFEILK